MLVVLNAPVQGVIDHAGRAKKMLTQAESLASKGKWSSARNKYWNIQRSHPETPEAIVANRRLQNGFLGTREIKSSGPSENRVDVLIMGDGYILNKLHTFKNDAKDVEKAFSRNKTLREYAGYFNYFEVGVFSQENGVDPPGEDKEDTALGTRYTNRNRSHVSVDRSRVAEIFNEIEFDDSLAVVLVHQVELGATGGGGIATLSKGAELDTICHEWGHAFAGLADEYDSDPGYTGDASESANLALTDNPEKVPWAHFLRDKYYKRKVGVHRGGGGRANGTWKPGVRNCTMMNGGDYCPVCREQILLAIYRYVDPIDSCLPEARAVVEVSVGEKVNMLEFEVSPMQPATHDLEISWWLLEGEHLPKLEPLRTRQNGRLRRLEGIDQPVMDGSSGRQKIKIDSAELDFGTWTVVCRVADSSVVGGHPWVLQDSRKLLQSERRWLIVK